MTGDRDLVQLVRDPAVRVLFTLRGVTKMRVLDEAGVLEHFGVPASRYGDFAILRGDPSDGLPGVRGVGEKTARELVKTYPSLDAMVADAGAIKRTGAPLQRSASLRAGLQDAAGYLEKMDRVARIRSCVAGQPGLAVCGAAYDGIGIPACVATAQAAAGQVAAHLRDDRQWERG